MTLRNFIKDNFVLVTGLALPVLLVAFFLMASALPRQLAPPPEHELLFSKTDYSSTATPFSTSFFVKDGRLHARSFENKSQGGSVTRIYTFNAKTNAVSEISYEVASKQNDIVLPPFQKLKLDSKYKAPDGYIFEQAGYGGGGLVTELFGGGRSRKPRLVKGSTVYPLPDEAGDRYSYYNIQFLGWVLEGK